MKKSVQIIGKVQGHLTYWNGKVQVYPANGKVVCRRVCVNGVFRSDDVRPDGQPVSAGYCNLFMNAEDMAAAIAAKKPGAGMTGVIIPALATTEETETKDGHTFSRYSVANGEYVLDDIEFDGTKAGSDKVAAFLSRCKAASLPEIVVAESKSYEKEDLEAAE